MPADAPQHFRLASEIKLWPLVHAVIALLPFVALALATGNALWMKASLLAISVVIGQERLALRPMGVIAHGLVVIAGTYLLLLAELAPASFVIACMALAASVTLLASRGEKLRALGNWIFVPVLILANELHGGRTVDALLRVTPAYLPYLLVALVPAVILAAMRSRGRPAARWSSLDDFGARVPLGEDLAAMLASVGITAMLVEHWRMEHAQWVIWGAASIVTGAVDSARVKLQNRAFGVVAGVPIGIVLGLYVVPHSELFVTLATLAGFLTLVAFQRYVVGYFFRCLFVALAIMLANQSAVVALERLTHVLLGGVIGIVCVVGVNVVVRRWLRRGVGS
jgi:hypothetical protein